MAQGGRAQGRTEAWQPHGLRRRAVTWTIPISILVRGATGRLRAWVVAEIEPGRLMPWLAVAFGAGVVIYFTAEREPSLTAAAALCAACVTAAFFARRRAVAFPILLGATAVAAGFAAATSRSAQVSHPILHHPAWNVTLSGWVEVRQERERTDRIVVRVHRIDGVRLDEAPERVRVSLRKGLSPPVGTFVELKARLTPPLASLRPNGYDFARDLYFQGIGATGFVLGAIAMPTAPRPPALWLQIAAAIDEMRSAIDRRIRASVRGDAGAIASALITGKRSAISESVNEAMYVSSLGHVLSISGYHMAVVAGVTFFAVRALLALAPGLALRRPIKKWAAVAALGMAAFYLLLSGAAIATQRAFVMTAIVLLGVLIDRPAITLRTLALAAFGVLLLTPEAVVHPSFQMSFAATLALVAAYERGLPWVAAGGKTSLGARIALWGGREIVAVLIASLVAGLATTLYAAYHFHRLAPYGVLANLLAIPIVSVVAMPAGLLGLVAMPFGFDGPLWQLMGRGIDWMIAVATWVAGLPGAVGRIHAFGIGAVLLGTAGLLVVCLLRTPLRWCGAVLIAIAALVALHTPKPDVLIASGVEAVAVRAQDGRLMIMQNGRNGFAVREWLAADGDSRDAGDPALVAGFRCDEIGCVAPLGDGALVAIVRDAEAFDEDCRRALVIISSRTAPQDCAAVVIDRTVWRRTGALALYRTADGFDMISARPGNHDRPWARARAQPDMAALARPAGRPSARDATPRMEDIEPDD